MKAYLLTKVKQRKSLANLYVYSQKTSAPWANIKLVIMIKDQMIRPCLV